MALRGGKRKVTRGALDFDAADYFWQFRHGNVMFCVKPHRAKAGLMYAKVVAARTRKIWPSQ